MKALHQLESIDFAPYLDQAFRVRLEGAEPIMLQLVRVEETGHAMGPSVRRPFSLQFVGPESEYYLPQHIYRLEHEETGAFDLFLVPLGPESGRMRYEAIFS